MLIYNYVSKKNENVKQQIVVQLLDRPFVHRWTDYLVKLSKRVPHIDWYITSQASNERYMEDWQTPKFIQKVHDSFVYFQKHNLGDFANIITEIEFLLKNPTHLKQSHLNMWHRWFTTLAGKYFGGNAEPYPESCTKDELYFFVHDVNGFAHRLEEYTYYDLERRRIFPICKQWSTQAHNAHNLNNLHNNIWDEMEYLEPGIFDFFNESYHHTVWMHEDILGKDQMKAWLDHDELGPSDITGNLFVTPNVTFDPYKIYPTILDREDFRNESRLSGKTIDRPPLGDIVNIDEVPWEDMVHYSVQSIELHGQTLWKV